jgi:aminoglycoside phosphotransferase (APT) family kinase protein
MRDAADAARFARVVAALDPTAVLRRTWSLRGGISSRMTVLEMMFPDGGTQRMVLRQPDGALRGNPRAAANEFLLLQRLRAAGLPTPAPQLLDESTELFPAPYLVIEYIDGAPELSPPNVLQPMTQFASRLVVIHRVEPARAGLAFLPTYTPRFIHQRDARYPDDSLRAAHIRDVLTRAWPSRSRNRLVLLHGDYWPGNVLWKDGRIVGVVDWEEACVGEPIVDLAIARLDMLWAFGIERMHEFTNDYRTESGFDLTDLPYWDLDAALRPVFNIGEWAAGWPGFGRPDVTEATMRAGHRQFVNQAFDALRA